MSQRGMDDKGDRRLHLHGDTLEIPPTNLHCARVSAAEVPCLHSAILMVCCLRHSLWVDVTLRFSWDRDAYGAKHIRHDSQLTETRISFLLPGTWFDDRYH